MLSLKKIIEDAKSFELINLYSLILSGHLDISICLDAIKNQKDVRIIKIFHLSLKGDLFTLLFQEDCFTLKDLLLESSEALIITLDSKIKVLSEKELRKEFVTFSNVDWYCHPLKRSQTKKILEFFEPNLEKVLNSYEKHMVNIIERRQTDSKQKEYFKSLMEIKKSEAPQDKKREYAYDAILIKIDSSLKYDPILALPEYKEEKNDFVDECEEKNDNFIQKRNPCIVM